MLRDSRGPGAVGRHDDVIALDLPVSRRGLHVHVAGEAGHEELSSSSGTGQQVQFGVLERSDCHLVISGSLEGSGSCPCTSRHPVYPPR